MTLQGHIYKDDTSSDSPNISEEGILIPRVLARRKQLFHSGGVGYARIRAETAAFFSHIQSFTLTLRHFRLSNAFFVTVLGLSMTSLTVRTLFCSILTFKHSY